MQYGGPQLNGVVPGTDEFERALVRRIALRDVRAFEMLYRQYRRRLLRFIGELIRQRDLLDEILDDTMLVVWKKAPQYNGTCLVSTWILSIGYREALRAQDRERRALRTRCADELRQSMPSAETNAIEGEAREEVRTVIAKLSVEHRAVVELSYFHDCGYHEIASIVGCPLNTVKTRMYHARRRLRTLLVRRGSRAAR